MSDPRRPAALRAVREHLDHYGHEDLTQVPVADVVDVILATLPEYRPGQLAVLRLAAPPQNEDESRLFADLAHLLASEGLRPVLMVMDEADLTVMPDPEESWRARWATDVAGRVQELAQTMRDAGTREAHPGDEHAMHLAADRLTEALPELLALTRSDDTPPTE